MSFTISCTTCRSRLRVQNESAVGQIVACPKCRSMVLIELPEGHESSVAPRESSGEITTRQRDADEAGTSVNRSPSSLLEGDVDQFLAGAAPPTNADPAENETVDEPLQAGKLPGRGELRDRVTQDEPAGSRQARQDSAVRPGTQRREESTKDSGDQVAREQPGKEEGAGIDSAPAARRDWISEESRQLRRWGMIGGVGVALSILVIVLIGLVISRRAGESSVAQQGPATRHGAEPADSDEQSPDVKAAVDRSERDSGDEAEEASGLRDGEGTRTDLAAEEMEHDEELGTFVGDDVTARNGSGEDQTDPLVENADVRRDSEGRGERDDSGPLPFEPEAIDVFEPFGPADDGPRGEGGTRDSSHSSSLAEGGGGAEGGPATPFPEAPGRRTFRLPPGLRDAEDLLLDRPADPTVFLADSSFDLIPVPGMPYDLGAAMPKPAPRQVNVTSQMNVRIPEVRFTEIPLWELIGFVSEFSTVPITLDADALERLGVAADTPVSLHATDLELGKILHMALEPLQLEHRTVDSQLLVTEKDRDRMEERTYEVRDLIGDDSAGPAALRSTVTGMIYPKTWEALGGSGTISLNEGRMTITQTPEVHFHVEIFCDHLRLARGLRPQKELPPNRSNLDLRIAAALPKLEQSYRADFPVPTKLPAILEQIGRDVGMHFVVDWISLKGAGWNPEALARLELQEEPLSTVLQELLGPMQLSFRVIDARTLQVTTEAVVAETLELGFFPLEDLRGDNAGQKVLEAVRAAIADLPKLERAGGGMRYDAPSQTLAVSAAQYQLAAVARQLEQLRLQNQ